MFVNANLDLNNNNKILWPLKIAGPPARRRLHAPVLNVADGRDEVLFTEKKTYFNDYFLHVHVCS